ncbi:thermonuclease family protein [Acuticoccus sp. I52.16.1]|uniref:thermonuclease family protein n=1 Tax=Acuticoccus sp. I52.16.1 TaxID=2928472 RepID=UPI001FD1A078|nr:hypothetical protein [Acuticoccus sp. I52.16.1]UOM36386.1 hypothetical protein MRB58_09435 [Acuticoccus sp. I52.16.1]
MGQLEDLPARGTMQEANARAAVGDPTPVAAPIILGFPSTADPAASRRPATTEAGDAAGAVDENGRPVRYVEGSGIAAPRPSGPLVREEQPTILPAAPARGPDPERFKLVVIENAGTVNVRSHRISLAYIDAPDAEATCTRPNGSTWPCGARARTALRRLVRRRAIDCLQLDRTSEAPVRAADCEVANTNLSQWMVEQGWARPTADAPKIYAELNKAAVDAGRGLYQADGR